MPRPQKSPPRLPKGWQLRRGAYYRRVRANGRDKLIRLGTSREEAMVADGRLAPKIATPAGALTVDEFVRQFTKERAAARRNDQGVHLLEQRFRDYVSPVIGRRLLAELEADPGHLYRLRGALDGAESVRGRGSLSPRTVSHILADVRCWLRYAERLRLIGRSPFDGELLPAVPDRPVKALSDVELRRALDASPPRWRAVMLFAVLTGMRYGEIRALDRSDVALEEPAHVLVWRSHGGSTKTRRARVAWLVPQAASLVLVPSGPVFPGLPVNAETAVKYAAKAVPGFTFHRLRHTTTAHLRAVGASDALIGEQLGQSQAKTTRGYGDDGGRALRERMCAAADRWSPANGDLSGDQAERELIETAS